MKISHHLHAPLARSAMRIDQRLRIDFEMRLGRRMDIARGPEAENRITFAQEDPARFARLRRLRLGEDLGYGVA